MTNPRLHRELVRTSHARKTYRVTLLGGDWPSETDIITFADDGVLGGPARHFGGHVEDVDARTKTVAVYVD